jgi:hypothetical protein
MPAPTENEITLTLVLYNADHENPDEHVLREHWDSWWDHPLPRGQMSRYLAMARAAAARFGGYTPDERFTKLRALFRLWGDSHAEKPEEGFRRASGYMKQIRAMLGEPSAEEEIEMLRLARESEEEAKTK